MSPRGASACARLLAILAVGACALGGATSAGAQSVDQTSGGVQPPAAASHATPATPAQAAVGDAQASQTPPGATNPEYQETTPTTTTTAPTTTDTTPTTTEPTTPGTTTEDTSGQQPGGAESGPSAPSSGVRALASTGLSLWLVAGLGSALCALGVALRLRTKPADDPRG